MDLEIATGTPRRLGWTLAELAAATGTSVAFWHKTIAKGEIPATKAGTKNIILDEDAREYLQKNRRIRGNGQNGKDRGQSVAA